MTIDRGFAALGLDPRLAEALAGLGYEEPTPVQREAIPPLLAGRDVLARAATGTGKTAAFALPLLHRLAGGSGSSPMGGRPGGLVLVPTRELAMQVTEAVQRYGRALGVRALALYGGAPMAVQLRALARGVEVVVATPGRALDHIRRGTLPLDGVRTVVLDEADEMLDMGFADDLEAILQAAPAARQTALFSATLPPRIAAIAQGQLRDPVEVTIAREVVAEGEVARVREVAVRVHRSDKVPALLRLLEVEAPAAAIVFCRTRTEVDELTEALQGCGVRAEALHGGLSQEQRDRVMLRFRTQRTAVLVATDVAARGLDVSHVTHVVNYDVPADVAAYVHRVGRTGRAGREGVAITLAEPREQRLLRVIEQVTGRAMASAPVPGNAALRAHREDARLELLAPLLAEHDGVTLAAAALVLLGAPLEVTEPEPGAEPPPRRERSPFPGRPFQGRTFPGRPPHPRPHRAGGAPPARDDRDRDRGRDRDRDRGAPRRPGPGAPTRVSGPAGSAGSRDTATRRRDR